MVYLENNNHQDARELCIKYGKNDPDLWRKAISAWSIRADDETIVNELKIALVHASEVLSVLTLIALLRECEGPLRIVTNRMLVEDIFMVKWDAPSRWPFRRIPAWGKYRDIKLGM